jgi:proteasome lid subunit RPN8/RPN11
MGRSINHPLNESSSGIVISQDHWAQMQAHVSSMVPEEACGLIAGEGNHARLILPVTNILHDRYRFRMDPKEQFEAFLQAETEGYEIIAIYHSHPKGIYRPSAADITELTFPGIIYLIWYQEANQWHCRAYLMQSKTGTGEVPVMISKKQ